MATVKADGHVWVDGYCKYCNRRKQKGYDISPCQAVKRVV